jgi:hypothetical protein
MIVWSPSTDDDPGIDPVEPAAAHPSPSWVDARDGVGFGGQRSAPSDRREASGEAREVTSRDD